MTRKATIEYHEIEKTPPSDLLALEYEEIDALIEQAREIRINAVLVSDWLTAIKLEKIVREDTEISNTLPQTNCRIEKEKA